MEIGAREDGTGDGGGLGRAGLALLAAALLLRIVFFVGPRTVDHFLYVQYAHEMLEGTFQLRPIDQCIRFGILLPVALLQALFGVNDLSSTLLSLASSALLLFSVHRLTFVLFGRLAALWGMALVALLPLDVIHSSLLYPDLPSAALAALAIALVVQESRREVPRRKVLALSGFILGVGITVKVVLLFPVLFLAVWMAWTRRWKLHWIFPPVVLVLLAYFGSFYALGEEPGYVLTQVRDVTLGTLTHDFYPAPSDLTARMTWKMPSILWNPREKEFPYLGWLAWSFVLLGWRQRKESGVRFLAGMWLFLFVLIWIFPFRLVPYLPALIAEARHFYLLVPSMAAVAAAGLVQLERKARMILFGVLAVASLSSSVLIRQYLVRYDAGIRAAFEVLREQKVRKISGYDVGGLYDYLSGYNPSYEITRLYVEDLDTLSGVHVVLEEDRLLRRSREDAAWVTPEEYASKLAPWREVWSGEFPERWDPRKLLGSGGSEKETYRVRILTRP